MASKYTKERLEEAVRNSTSFAGVVRYLGLRQAGGTQSHLATKIRQYEIDVSHFTGSAHNRGQVANNRKTPEEILVVMPEGSNRQKRAQLLRAMTESNIEYTCTRAGCEVGSVWNSKELTLEINHIDGDWLNNKLDNLEFVCPNCHSQEAHTNKPHKYRK